MSDDISVSRADVQTLLAVVPNAVGHRYRPLWERLRDALYAQDSCRNPECPRPAHDSVTPYCSPACELRHRKKWTG